MLFSKVTVTKLLYSLARSDFWRGGASPAMHRRDKIVSEREYGDFVVSLETRMS